MEPTTAMAEDPVGGGAGPPSATSLQTNEPPVAPPGATWAATARALRVARVSAHGFVVGKRGAGRRRHALWQPTSRTKASVRGSSEAAPRPKPPHTTMPAAARSAPPPCPVGPAWDRAGPPRPLQRGLAEWR